MATGQYFTITDGTTSALFADGADPPGDTNYEIRSAEWAPAIAGLRTGQIASGGPFEDVIEDIPINIKGSTVAACLLNLQTLQQLFDQAERWYLRRDNATVVEVRYSPKGATVSTAAEPLRAPIYGRVPGDANCVQLPPEFTGPLLSNSKYVVGARMRFVRRGQWTLTTFQTVTSTSQTNGDLHTLAFGATNKFPSITKLKINGVAFGVNHLPQLLAISEKANGIVIANAEAGVPATDFSSVDDSANFARNTNILRFTPTVTTERESGVIAITVESDARLFGVYANIRNNSSFTSFRVRLGIKSTTVTNFKTYTPYRPIVSQATARPAWEFIGPVALPVQANQISIACVASAAAGTLDIDTIVLVDLTNVLHVLEIRHDGATGGIAGNTAFYMVHPKLSTADGGTNEFGLHRPILRGQTGADSIILPYDGNLYLPTRATTIYAALLGADNTTLNNWRLTDGAGVVLSGTMVAERFISYLVPE